MLSSTEMIWSIAIAVVLAGSLAYIFWKQRRDAKKAAGPGDEKKAPEGTLSLQLQAYERLILLTDRIALPNLVSRIPAQGMTARDYQAVLTQTIRQEFDHNITQQMYVSAEGWDAVRNLKEQNLLVVNQVASFLPADAGGGDLARALVDLIMQNPRASLHPVVADALAFEAKKLMH